MSASGVRAGAAFVELSLKDKIGNGLNAIKQKMQSVGAGLAAVGGGLMGLGASGLGAFGAAAKMFSDAGSELQDMNARTGLSVEALSSFKYAAEQTGASLGDVEAGQKKLQKAMVEAAGGSKEAKDALADVGLTVEQLATMSPEDQFRAVSKGIAGIENPAKRTSAAMAIMGKSATNLMGMMQDLGALEGQHDKLGIGLTTADAAAADAMGDAWGDLVAVGKGLVNQIGAALAPTITGLITNVVEVASATLKWIKDNRGLVIAVAGVTAGIAAAGAVLVALGVGMSVIGTVVGGIVPVITALGGAMAFLVSPVGLVGVGIAALAGYMIYSSGVWKGWLAGLTEGFNIVKEDALAAFGAIRDALSAGDIGLAWSVAVAFIQLEWARVTGYLLSNWGDWIDGFSSMWESATAGMATFFVNGIAGIRTAWISLVGFLDEFWADFLNTFNSTWQTAVNATASPIAYLMAKAQGLDPDEVAQTLKEDQERATAKVKSDNAGRTARVNERQKGRDQEAAGIEENRSSDVSGIQAQRDAAIAEQRRKTAEGNGTAIQEAEKRLADLQKQASEAANKVAAESKKKANHVGSLDELKSVDTKISTTGTFAASSVRGLGGGSAAERTARATEATVTEVKKLRDKTEREKVG